MNTGGTIDQLTERERQVFLMVVDGLTNSAIAERLQISRRTVETHIRTVLRKMGVTRRSELISTYLREQNEQPSRRGKMWLKETPRTHPWSDQLQRLVDRGDHDAAFQLITRLVEVEHSWELVLDILRVGEMLSRPTEALRYAAVAEDALDGEPMSFGVERAIWFYRGRILYHLGLYRYAMDFYRRNIPEGKLGLGDPYQRSSRQAIAHLLFRVEAFRQAEIELGRLYDELSEVLDPDLRFVADVLQYRATLSSICLVHDLPFSEASGMPLDVNATEHFGAEALSISEANEDREGVVLGAHRACLRRGGADEGPLRRARVHGRAAVPAGSQDPQLVQGADAAVPGRVRAPAGELRGGRGCTGRGHDLGAVGPVGPVTGARARTTRRAGTNPHTRRLCRSRLPR